MGKGSMDEQSEQTQVTINRYLVVSTNVGSAEPHVWAMVAMPNRAMAQSYVDGVHDTDEDLWCTVIDLKQLQRVAF